MGETPYKVKILNQERFLFNESRLACKAKFLSASRFIFPLMAGVTPSGRQNGKNVNFSANKI